MLMEGEAINFRENAHRDNTIRHGADTTCYEGYKVVRINKKPAELHIQLFISYLCASNVYIL